MSFALGAAGIVRGTVHHPARGTWVADLELNTDEEITGTQTLSLPNLDLVGTVDEGGVVGVKQKVRVVGGKGGLSKEVKGQPFNKAQVRNIVNYLLGQAGEALDAASDPAILNRQVEHWTHRTGSAGRGLDLLMEAVDSTWYVTPAGSVHIGDHAWLDSDVEVALLAVDLVGRSRTVSALDDTVQPGTVFFEERVSSVEHIITGYRSRSVVHWGDDGHPLDSVLRDLVLHYSPQYMPDYAAQVVTMNADGTVDLKPEAEEVGPGWQNVEIALQGLFRVKVQPGARCKVSFLDNNPQKPYVAQFFPGTQFTSAEMESGAEAARKGDGAGYLTFTFGPVGPGVGVTKVGWSNIIPAGHVPLPPGAIAPGNYYFEMSITGGSSVVKKVK